MHCAWGEGLTRDTKSVYGAKTPNGKEFLVPKATRDYDGVEFSVRGQAYRNLNINASYTYSRLWGNYAGLANSDENGRSNPNNDRAFDLPFYYFDASGSQQNVFGRLATDSPHTRKVFASYNLNTRAGQTIFGLNQIAYSGTPLSTSVIYQSAPTYPNGRNDLGRTPVLTQTDFQISHTIKASERYTVKLEAGSQRSEHSESGGRCQLPDADQPQRRHHGRTVACECVLCWLHAVQVRWPCQPGRQCEVPAVVQQADFVSKQPRPPSRHPSDLLNRQYKLQ